jgi:hypothetical protein
MGMVSDAGLTPHSATVRGIVSAVAGLMAFMVAGCGVPFAPALLSASDVNAIAAAHIYSPGSTRLHAEVRGQTAGTIGQPAQPAVVNTWLRSTHSPPIIWNWYRTRLAGLGWSFCNETTDLPDALDYAWQWAREDDGGNPCAVAGSRWQEVLLSFDSASDRAESWDGPGVYEYTYTIDCCGLPQSASPSAAPAPSGWRPTFLTSPGTVALTLADKGRYLTLPPGSAIDLNLSEPTPGYTWTDIYSTDTSVVRVTYEQRFPGGKILGTLSVVGTGTTSLFAVNSPDNCNCGPPGPSWSIIVLAVDS